jgi:SPP1 gp7 family putative phage head morphogenesis protein
METTQREQNQLKLNKQNYDDIIAGLYEKYHDLLLELESEYDSFFGKFSENGKLTISDMSKKLSYEDSNALKYLIVRFLDKVSDVELMNNRADSYRKYLNKQKKKKQFSRQDLLEIKLRDKLFNLGNFEEKRFKKYLPKVYKDSYLETSWEIDKLNGFNQKLEIDTDRIYAKWLDSNFITRIWKNKDDLQQNIMKEIQTNIVANKNSKERHEQFSKVINKSYNKTLMLAGAETTNAMNLANIDSYKHHTVEKYQYVAVMNEKTCPVCGKLNGKVFKISEAIIGVNYPLIHPNCRCTTLPYIEYSEDSTTINYSDWLKKVNKV